MKKFGFLLYGILGLLVCTFNATAGGGRYHATAGANPDLKKYMGNFGTMLASLEILRLKEKKIDWEAVDVALQEMNNNLAAMQKADRMNAYKEFTDVLAAGFIELNEKAKRRDKNFFHSLEKLSEACFKCHAAHRPGDYLIPKDNQPLMSNHRQN